jgi:low affinity Fe/Cu permease
MLLFESLRLPRTNPDFRERPMLNLRHQLDRQSGAISFARFARWTERQVGSPIAFAIAVAIVVLWAGSGPLFGWSDTWQLVINTGTTIVTFLMVFLIQSSQSRDTQAVHLKLDELIRVNRAARNSLLNLEEMSEDEVEQVKNTFTKLMATREAEAPKEAA